MKRISDLQTQILSMFGILFMGWSNRKWYVSLFIAVNSINSYMFYKGIALPYQLVELSLFKLLN